MIYFKTNEEIDLIRKSCLLVSRTLAEIAKYINPGVTTIELDRVAEAFIIKNDGKPAFLRYQGYPNTLCISVNDTVLHGLPSLYSLKEGDIVSIDCGVLLNNFYGDSCYTFMVGNVSRKDFELCKVTYNALENAITAAKEGNRFGNIGFSIQNHVESNNFEVIKNYSGHGIGRNLHEAPLVRNFGKPMEGTKLVRGMVLAIEPMVSKEKSDVVIASDGWSVKTVNGENSAHFEHTIVIRDGKTELLSTFSSIEEAIKENRYLWQNSLL
jgi:methionyl aminopeptidase